jgi:pimeloyl-ACP methyl ester carboxylesterase
MLLYILHLLKLIQYSSIYIKFIIVFLLIRFIHRIWWQIDGHKYQPFLDPHEELSRFLSSIIDKDNNDNIDYSKEYTFNSKDNVILKYHKIGNGNKKILLLNGVGTGLFMWVPVFKGLLKFKSNIFNEITIIIPSYRGLFGSNNINNKIDVNITLPIIANDIHEIMNHSKINRFDCIIGWSLGALTALILASTLPITDEKIKTDGNTKPLISDKLFLLNPSSGETLHTVLQSFYPLPKFIGAFISFIVKGLLTNILKPLTYTSIIWDILKLIAFSFPFRIFLFLFAFMGGFPPEQPPYFHAYMKDTFKSREHTRGLLDLICSLDIKPQSGSLCLPHKTTIISGFPDNMTGVYHSQILAKQMPNNKHVMFSMGSHFVLLEWPSEVAKEILELIFVNR